MCVSPKLTFPHLVTFLLGHENFSMAVLYSPPIIEGHLSITGKRMHISAVKLHKRLAEAKSEEKLRCVFDDI